jgi:hypothetical protein
MAVPDQCVYAILSKTPSIAKLLATWILAISVPPSYAVTSRERIRHDHRR